MATVDTVETKPPLRPNVVTSMRVIEPDAVDTQRRPYTVDVLAVVPESVTLDYETVRIKGIRDFKAYRMPILPEISLLYGDHQSGWTIHLAGDRAYAPKINAVEQAYESLLKQKDRRLILDTSGRWGESLGMHKGSGIVSVDLGGVNTLLIGFSIRQARKQPRPPTPKKPKKVNPAVQSKVLPQKRPKSAPAPKRQRNPVAQRREQGFYDLRSGPKPRTIFY